MLLFSFQGKSVIRPIAFRPTPGPSSGASTPTNGYVVSSFRPPSSNFDFGGPHPNVRASPATSMTHVVMGGVPPPPPPHPNYNNEGFAPGHPLIKDGRRHYGSKLTFQFTDSECCIFWPAFGCCTPQTLIKNCFFNIFMSKNWKRKKKQQNWGNIKPKKFKFVPKLFALSR